MIHPVSPSVRDKADRLLTNGDVTINEVTQGCVIALVKGDHALYGVGWSADEGWRCTCESRRVMCSHVVAVRTIVDRGGKAA